MRYENYPIEKYRFFKTGKNEIIAETTFAGKKVRASAKLNPGDVFDEDFGRRLAAARCNKKVTEKRLKKAKERLDVISEILSFVHEDFEESQDYLSLAIKDNERAEKLVQAVLDETK